MREHTLYHRTEKQYFTVLVIQEIKHSKEAKRSFCLFGKIPILRDDDTQGARTLEVLLSPRLKT